MNRSHNDHMIFDRRTIFLLEALHDAHGVNKSSLYRNTNERILLDSLIERNFVEEVPTPFSNKRTCLITERGKTLYEALLVVEEILSTDPESEIIIRVSNTRNDEVPENTPSETIAKNENGDEEVLQDQEKEEEPVTPLVDETAFVDGKLLDANGQVIAEKIEPIAEQQTLEDVILEEKPEVEQAPEPEKITKDQKPVKVGDPNSFSSLEEAMAATSSKKMQGKRGSKG